MSSEPQPNWEKKLEQMQAGLSDSFGTDGQNRTNFLPVIRDWFLALPNPAKIVVGLGGAMLFLSLLNTVFSLLKLLLSLSILAVIVYFGYQFVASKNQK